MSLLSIILIALAMSTDAFAAAVGKGAAMHKPRFPDALRTGVIFGTIEGLTPVIGWLLGLAAANYISEWDHWIAFTLLSMLGIHMIYAGVKSESAEGSPDGVGRPDGFWSLAATGFATSIDAMAVGVGLAFLDVNIAFVALVIGLTTLVMVTLGIMLGRILGALAGKRAEILGGIVLIAVGATILHEHLSAERKIPAVSETAYVTPAGAV
ncbi:MAG: manganese efflux pump MntP [Gammaproteobacteria bacterium]|nr:manganese efflux pump MntP [Gammaproteobacteria bacterium]